jgi:hypothetical protein
MAASDNKPAQIINAAYNDSGGITSDFILNSLTVVSRIAGININKADFRMVVEYNNDKHAVELFAECIAPCEVLTNDGKDMIRSFQPGDRIFIEQSGKFTDSKIRNMVAASGLLETRSWSDRDNYFRVMELHTDIPGTVTQLNRFIFQHLIGSQNLSYQPILLRNPFAFYWGHISVPKWATTTGSSKVLCPLAPWAIQTAGEYLIWSEMVGSGHQPSLVALVALYQCMTTMNIQQTSSTGNISF